MNVRCDPDAFTRAGDAAPAYFCTHTKDFVGLAPDGSWAPV